MTRTEEKFHRAINMRTLPIDELEILIRDRFELFRKIESLRDKNLQSQGLLMIEKINQEIKTLLAL